MKGRETRPTKGPDHERLSPLVSAHAVYGEPGRHQLYDNVLRPSGLRVTQFSATRPGRSPLRPRRLHPIAVCGRSTIRAPSASPPRMVRADSAAVALCRKQARPFFPPDEAGKRSPNFLREELEARLRTGSVAFRLLLQLAEGGDPTDDVTALWRGRAGASGSHGHVHDERGQRAAPDLRPHQQNGRH